MDGGMQGQLLGSTTTTSLRKKVRMAPPLDIAPQSITRGQVFPCACKPVRITRATTSWPMGLHFNDPRHYITLPVQRSLFVCCRDPAWVDRSVPWNPEQLSVRCADEGGNCIDCTRIVQPNSRSDRKRRYLIELPTPLTTHNSLTHKMTGKEVELP
ncbi:hypothetical protein M413DRAFT_113368 [Hebeloma cylindrosporum]|uniref:Uncharacterized protein n=1 Tax=Hebeloma cylindrosporum TaxID=76867 RepID=A0A0C2Z948_HEBCY|nr:hypothetical protein M413DRAFT_113368 [Hebeloma cylindrosporum h7]